MLSTWLRHPLRSTHSSLAISNTEVLAALVIYNASLTYLKRIASKLQVKAKDIVEAVGKIDTVQCALNVDVYHSQWFSSVEKM